VQYIEKKEIGGHTGKLFHCCDSSPQWKVNRKETNFLVALVQKVLIKMLDAAIAILNQLFLSFDQLNDVHCVFWEHFLL
jgi:hypothetical protein